MFNKTPFNMLSIALAMLMLQYRHIPSEKQKW